MDNIQQIADAVQTGLELIIRAGIQQGRTRLTAANLLAQGAI